MEGANLSGDLADPGFAIPYGTLAAVSTAFFFYIMLIFGQVSPRTSAYLSDCVRVRLIAFECILLPLIAAR